MKLGEAFRLGRECGISTIEGCVDNVGFHCLSLFLYSDINRELNGLVAELKRSTCAHCDYLTNGCEFMFDDYCLDGDCLAIK